MLTFLTQIINNAMDRLIDRIHRDAQLAGKRTRETVMIHLNLVIIAVMVFFVFFDPWAMALFTVANLCINLGLCIGLRKANERRMMWAALQESEKYAK